jgi:hypothetical protein
MRRLLSVLLGFLVLIVTSAEVWAASKKAMALRQANGLASFTPPDKFLAGNFVADELNPKFIYGPVKNFVASRKCPTTWLIETGDKNRPAWPRDKDEQVEYTIFLEEDCPNKVIYYVFVDQSRLTPEQWIAWRKRFHGSTKTEPAYGSTKSKLDKACQDGCGIDGELRFIQIDGELLTKSPEEVLIAEKYSAVYDLDQQKKISK